MDELKARLADVNSTLEGIRGEITLEREARERQISMAHAAIAVAIAAAVVGAAINFWLILKVWDQADRIVADRTTGRVAACERENQSKADTRAGFDRMITQLGAIGAQTPERAALVARFREEFFAGLPTLEPRDCTPDAVNRAAKG